MSQQPTPARVAATLINPFTWVYIGGSLYVQTVLAAGDLLAPLAPPVHGTTKQLRPWWWLSPWDGVRQ